MNIHALLVTESIAYCGETKVKGGVIDSNAALAPTHCVGILVALSRFLEIVASVVSNTCNAVQFRKLKYGA